MPRNLELLLENYIEENKFEQFVLTFAIQQGIVVPQRILKKFGSGYGFDNFFSSPELLKTKQNSLIELKEQVNSIELIPEREIRKMIKVQYDKDLEYYHFNLDSYKDKMSKLNFIERKTNSIRTSNQLQKQFKNKILKFIKSEILSCKKQYMFKIIKPKKLEMVQFIKNYKISKRQEYLHLASQIKKIKRELFQDPILCEQIAKEWLGKK